MGQYYNAVVGNENTKTYSVFKCDFKKLAEHLLKEIKLYSPAKWNY